MCLVDIFSGLFLCMHISFHTYTGLFYISRSLSTHMGLFSYTSVSLHVCRSLFIHIHVAFHVYIHEKSNAMRPGFLLSMKCVAVCCSELHSHHVAVCCSVSPWNATWISYTYIHRSLFIHKHVAFHVYIHEKSMKCDLDFFYLCKSTRSLFMYADLSVSMKCDLDFIYKYT
jgi:hypothetical protein